MTLAELRRQSAARTQKDRQNKAGAEQSVGDLDAYCSAVGGRLSALVGDIGFLVMSTIALIMAQSPHE